MAIHVKLALAAAALLAAGAAQAQRPSPLEGELITGYLCCNMRTYGKSVSDINYREGTTPLAIGTPARITMYQRVFFDAEVGGKPQRFKNDYSRSLGGIEFGQRYIVKADPRAKLASFEPAVRDAILAGKVARGMTREQVTMALGYPVTIENPKFDAAVWHYWIGDASPLDIGFAADQRVDKVSGDAAALSQVYLP